MKFSLGSIGRRLGQLRLGQCLVCERWPQATVCAACTQQFTQPIARCETCAIALAPGLLTQTAGERTLLRCVACTKTPAPLGRCFAAVDYAYPWDGLVQQFKYQQQPGLAPMLAALWQAEVVDAPAAYAVSQPTWLLPIPMSPQRLAQRGYNQSRLLARALVHLVPTLQMAPEHWLVRNPATDNLNPQAENTRTERLKRMKHAFVVPPDAATEVAGNHVLLLDDVMTTGATLFAAARALRHAGTAGVDAVCLARTPAE